MAEYQTVGSLDDFPDGEMRQVIAHGDPVAVFRRGDDVFAISDICTHEETYLTDGEFDVEELEVECPLHGSRFNVVNGDVRILPATKPIDTYTIKIEGGLVHVGPRNHR